MLAISGTFSWFLTIKRFFWFGYDSLSKIISLILSQGKNISKGNHLAEAVKEIRRVVDEN